MVTGWASVVHDDLQVIRQDVDDWLAFSACRRQQIVQYHGLIIGVSEHDSTKYANIVGIDEAASFHILEILDWAIDRVQRIYADARCQGGFIIIGHQEHIFCRILRVR